MLAKHYTNFDISYDSVFVIGWLNKFNFGKSTIYVMFDNYFICYVFTFFVFKIKLTDAFVYRFFLTQF